MSLGPIVAVDFDGTVVTHDYPRIGSPVPGAIEGLKVLQHHGIFLILWTMRHGKQLEEAVEYLAEHGIELYGVNENPAQKTWTESPKVYAQVYIDDAALGCPLVHRIAERPYVEWDGLAERVLSSFGIEYTPE